jgi:hypothetical protein
MASGTIDLGTSGKIQGRINWNSASNGTDANSSNVYAEIQVKRTDSYTTKGIWNFALNINGTNVEAATDTTSISSSWVTIGSRTQTVAHDNDGKKSCYIGGWINGPSGTSQSDSRVSGGETVTLDTIPRYLTITSHSIKSKTVNSFVVSWATDVKRDYTQYSLNGGAWTDAGDSVASDGKSGSYTISGLTPNTTYTIKTRLRRADSGLYTESSALSVTTYDIARLVSVPNINIGSSQTITWTNPYGSLVGLKLCTTDGTTIKNYGWLDGTSKTVTPPASTIYDLTPNSNTYTARYIITTFENNVSYTNYKDFLFTVTDSNPTFSNFTYANTNTTSYNGGTLDTLTGSNQILVKGFSNVKVTIGTGYKAVAKNSATMKSYSASIGTKTASANYSSSAEVTMTMNAIDGNTIKVYAIDSRTNSTAVTKTVTVKEYSDLTINEVTATRGSNGVGTDVTLAFNGKYWANSFGAVTNDITKCFYQYKKTGTSTWTTGATGLTYTKSNGTYSGSISIQGDAGATGFSVEDSFDIRLTVADKLVTKTFDMVLGSGTPAIAIYKNNIAIGKKYDKDLGGALQVDGDIYMGTNKVLGFVVTDSWE